MIVLDGRYYKLIDEFEDRFPSGTPSLKRCDRLTVDGDVTFGAGVVIEGDAAIRTDGRATVEDGTLVRGSLEL